MAIRKKEQEPTLPNDLQRQAREAMALQNAATILEEQYKERRTQFFTEIESRTDVEIVAGKGIRTPEGLVVWQIPTDTQVDPAKVAEAVTAGTLDLIACLSLVSKWNLEAISALIPGAVTKSDRKGFGMMRANPEFKAWVQSKVACSDILTVLEIGKLAEVAA